MTFGGGGREFGGGGVYSIGGIFLDGVKLAKFQLVGGGGGIPPSHPVWKTLALGRSKVYIQDL